MTNKEKLKQVKLTLSPITDKVYIGFVKDNIITDRVELTLDELREFCFVSALGIFAETGASIEKIEGKNKKAITISMTKKDDEQC